MKFVSIREFRSSTARIKNLLPNEKIVLTSNGKPVALIIEANEENFENLLDDIRIAQAHRAIKDIQTRSESSGLSNMSLEKINAEIAAARQNRVNK